MTTCLGKSCSFTFTVLVFRESLSICVSAFFPFGFEGGMWDDLIVLVPDHCLCFHFNHWCNWKDSS